MIVECIAWGVIALTFFSSLVIIDVARALNNLNKKLDVLNILDKLECIEKEAKMCRANCHDIQRQLGIILSLEEESECKSKD